MKARSIAALCRPKLAPISRFLCDSSQRPKAAGKGGMRAAQLAGLLAAGGLVGWLAAETIKEKPTPSDSSPDELAEPQARITERVYLDIAFDDQPADRANRIVIGLYGDACPKTALNFKALCVGDKQSTLTGRALAYRGSVFHRVIPAFMIQGGDFTAGDGTGGESIYGLRFPDENFRLKHRGVGVVSMANRGPDTNSSQFFLTLAPCPWLDGRHVAFAQVLHGLHVLRAIEARGSRLGGVAGKVQVVGCGLLPPLEESLSAQYPPGGEQLDEMGRDSRSIMK